MCSSATLPVSCENWPPPSNPHSKGVSGKGTPPSWARQIFLRDLELQVGDSSCSSSPVFDWGNVCKPRSCWQWLLCHIGWKIETGGLNQEKMEQMHGEKWRHETKRENVLVPYNLPFLGSWDPTVPCSWDTLESLYLIGLLPRLIPVGLLFDSACFKRCWRSMLCICAIVTVLVTVTRTVALWK